MNLHNGRIRHEADETFIDKFTASFGESHLTKLVLHLDEYPEDGDKILDLVPELKSLPWDSDSRKYEVVYLFRKRLGMIVYIDCIEQSNASNGWFKNVDPLQLLERVLGLIDIVDKLLGPLLRTEPKRSLAGVSSDVYKGKGDEHR